jgi:hypothetical protein
MVILNESRTPAKIIDNQMAPRKLTDFEPVTMGHIRGHRVTRLLVYCGAINCSHSTVLDGASLSDDVVLRSLGPRMVCKACGHVGADVRPDWSQRTNPPGAVAERTAKP